MANTIDDLRTHLFETLKALKDPEKPMELDRARAIADVSKVIVESAKVEVDFLKVTGATQSTEFLPVAALPSRPALQGQRPREISAVPKPSQAPSEVCLLCGVKLTTPYLIERGLCGSCSDRPEARQLKTGTARP